jgi:hypothetical protein
LAKHAIRLIIPILTIGFATVSIALADEKKADQSACFARLKKLVGDWMAKDGSGKEHLVLRYRTISGGTALEETALPGSEEMVSIYHMDNGKLVMTHYCSMGNQPHLEATAASTPSRIEFVCTGKGTNMKSEDDMHIHHAVFTLSSEDRFESSWGAAAKGKAMGQEEKFQVYRKPAK